MEKARRRGQNRTKCGGKERPARAWQEVKEEDEKAYVGRGCAGVLGVLRRGGSLYILEPTIFVTYGTENWSWRLEGCTMPIWTCSSFKKKS